MYHHDNESGMTYEIVEYKPRRKKSGWAKLAVVCLLISCFGMSLGFGFGISRVLPLPGNAEIGLTNGEAQAVTALSDQSQSITFVNTPPVLQSTNGVINVVKQSASSVVSINISGTVRNVFNRSRQFDSAGSGIIIGEDSERLYIATNNHVISNASNVTISVDDSSQVTANYVGSDFESDLAVISVTKADMLVAGVPYRIAMIGNSDVLEVGEIVVAIGNALGEGKTATMGIISAMNKQLNIEGRSITALQTDAAINPGNSGGALVNMRGEVIGINTAKLSDIGVEGMGYSIPINEALVMIAQLIEKGPPVQSKPYLGIEGTAISEQVREYNSLPSVGIYVHSVIGGSSAEEAGIKSGDIIVGFGEKKITTFEDLQEALQASKVGDTVDLTLYRNRTLGNIKVTLKGIDLKF